MAAALGNKQNLLMANHGILTTGETVSDGFDALYYFEKSAETYLTALATGKELNIASHEVAEKTAQDWADYPSDLGRAHLDQIRIILIILVSVSIFGLIVFVLVKNYIRNKINQFIKDEDNKKLK